MFKNGIYLKNEAKCGHKPPEHKVCRYKMALDIYTKQSTE